MRISIQLFLFFVFMNAFAGIFAATPLGDHLGIDPDPGGEQEIEAAEADAQNVSSSSGTQDTLFGLYNSVASVFEGLINSFPALAMMKNAGAPAWLVNYGFAGYGFLTAFDAIGYLRDGGLMR